MNNVKSIVNRSDDCFDVVLTTDNGKFVVAKCWDSLLCDEIANTVREYLRIQGTDPISKEESERLNDKYRDELDESGRSGRKTTLTLKQLKRLVNEEYGSIDDRVVRRRKPGFRKSMRRFVKESDQKDWMGIKGAKHIWHGEWGDPEIQYKGFSLNYWDVMEGPHNVYCEEHPEDEKETGFDEWLKDYDMESELIDLVYAQLGDNGLSNKPWLGIKDAYLVKELNGKPVEGKVYYKGCLVDLDDFEYYDEEYDEMLSYSDSPKSYERYFKKHQEHKDEVIDELDRAVSEYI